ncbi:MAG: enoyl-CoA hydratase [bacterium]|nr:enoyl-CoA hydratase [bacterium]
MGEEKVLFDVVDGVGAVTFNRPDQANAMDLEVMQHLMHISIECDEDPAIRSVIITGNGSFFSAGGDLASFQSAGDHAGSLIKEMTTYYHAAISRFSRMNAPVIAAVNGMAAGAGFSLVAACDLAIAAESSRYTSAYTAASLSPDGSSTYFVPRLVGMRRAMELMVTNRRLSAQEALEWGLVNRVVPDEELMGTAMDLARELAHGATLAFGKVKELLHNSFTGTLETQMEFEARGIAGLTHTHDGREGVAAFSEKRAPNFEGR